MSELRQFISLCTQAEDALLPAGGMGTSGSLVTMVRQAREKAEQLSAGAPHPDAPVITATPFPAAVRGQPFGPYQIDATATGSPITGYGAQGLPAGLTVDTTTGIISGTPTVAVTNRPVTLTATNDEGTGRVIVRMTISAPGTGPGPVTPTPPWASDLTFSFPGTLQSTPPPPIGGSPFNLGLNGIIHLTRLTGWDPAYAVDFTDAKLYPPGGHTQANVPIKLHATYAGGATAGIELEIDFDYTSDVTPSSGPNKITKWGYSSGDLGIYIEGSNGTGAPIALRITKP